MQTSALGSLLSLLLLALATGPSACATWHRAEEVTLHALSECSTPALEAAAAALLPIVEVALAFGPEAAWAQALDELPVGFVNGRAFILCAVKAADQVAGRALAEKRREDPIAAPDRIRERARARLYLARSGLADAPSAAAP